MYGAQVIVYPVQTEWVLYGREEQDDEEGMEELPLMEVQRDVM